MKKWFLAALSVSMLPYLTIAQEENKNWQVHNRLIFEYDDNIYETSENEQGSPKIVEEVEFHVNLNLERTVVTARYRPTYVYWFDREEDDSDFHHILDTMVNHRFSPALTVNVTDSFKFQENPAFLDQGTGVREVDDYLHNDFGANADMGLADKSRLILAGRYLFTDYEDSEVAEQEDYDIFVVGATLDQRMSPQTGVRGEARVEDTSYDTTVTRDAQSLFLGGGVEHTFNPSFLGDLRGGWQYKEITDAVDSEINSPYFDASVTFLPSPATRLSTGIGFSQFEAYVYPYSNQARLQYFASFSRDFTARISWFNTLSLSQGEYDADQLSASALEASETGIVDGDENILRFGSRVSYRIDRSNWVEAGLSLLTFDSDLRDDYDRNHVNLAWKTKL